MSRAAIPGLPSRYPIGGQLPALYADDDFAQRFTAGLDTVLAPVFSTLDNLPAYLDPRVAPVDFLEWLSSWVGVADDPDWPVGLRREAVVRAVELHRWRGTRRGLVEALRLAVGVRAEVVGDGGAAWSATPGSDLPAEPAAELLIRVAPDAAGPGAAGLDVDRVHEIVRAMCPVHVAFRVEVVEALPGAPDEEGN
ncbi:phage tail protein [Actinopolymorpha pittospori]|uniref:Phage tail-like protein n=1 Tax=Actinopolymorpha pittospori TaxID=648752 RepID=A0A927MN81_9ACTN|nr:phage tail protein [Actinopolymorpha pittospori]MBE1603801.1 phage tail-like protein [Actinopolymorpha pittospori]